MTSGTIYSVGNTNSTITISDGTTTYYFQATSASPRDLFVEDGVLYGFAHNSSRIRFGKLELTEGEELSTDPSNPAKLTFTEIKGDSNDDGVGDNELIGNGGVLQGSDIYDSGENTALVLDDSDLLLMDLDDQSYTNVVNSAGNPFAFANSGFSVSALDVAEDTAGNKYLFYARNSGQVSKLYRATLTENPDGTLTISDETAHVQIETNTNASGVGYGRAIDIVDNPDAPGGKSIVSGGKFITSDSVNIFTQTGDLTDAQWEALSPEYAGSTSSNEPFATWQGELPLFAFPCFTAGTDILTPGGMVAVENLKVGDLVTTLDHGPQVIRWAGHRRLGWLELLANPKQRPIRISAGALGAGTPERDLTVSPQHRVLIRSRIVERMFGCSEILIEAKKLLDIDGIEIVTQLSGISYHHILLDEHEIICSNSAATESLFQGAEALKMVGDAAAEEIMSIFPELAEEGAKGAHTLARYVPDGGQRKHCIARHGKNKKALIDKVLFQSSRQPEYVD